MKRIVIAAAAALIFVGGFGLGLFGRKLGLVQLVVPLRLDPIEAAWRESVHDLTAESADTLIIGDSISEPVDWTAALGRPVSNRAFGGNTVARAVSRPLLPAKTVIILLGINDLKFGASTELTIDAYRRLLEAYRRTGARLIVVSTFTGVETLVAPVAKLNAAIAANCRCTFVDLREAFGGERVPKTLSSDGIHLTLDGYRVLIPAVRRVL